MKFEFTGYDKEGIPTHVNTDDGFMRTGRKFVIKEDGWMLDQLDFRDFPMIEAGRQMEDLVIEVNSLRRENFNLKSI